MTEPISATAAAAASRKAVGFLARHKTGVLATGLLSVPAAGLTCLLLVGLLLVSGNAAPASAGCALPIGEGGVAPASLTSEQRANARAIISVGKESHVSAYGWVIAVAAAMTESGLRNLDHGDRDSLGLFQQRPSQGWGSPAQVLDPAYAAAAFYGGPAAPANRGLLDIAGWQQLDVATAAQAVQRSAFPTAYRRWAEFAAVVVSDLAGPTATCKPAGVPGGASGSMIAVALAQVGKPYVWGATGPDAFDCSGLVVFSWRQAGYALPVRTAAQMHAEATPVAAGDERPGDLIFSEFGSRGLGADNPGHVAIVVQPGMLVEAPSEGVPVRVRRYAAADSSLVFGRFPVSALRPFG